MPTALLPGIGASIRSERAARAIARSSDSASIRLTLTSGAGWTSYWVTTGPALRPTILAGMPKPASFLTMISSLRSWAAWSPPALIGRAMSSSVVIGGRTYSIRSFVGGESPASVTSSGSRSGRRDDERRRASATARAGANVDEIGPGLGMALGIVDASSSPQAPVWPGDGPAGTGSGGGPTTSVRGLDGSGRTIRRVPVPLAGARRRASAAVVPTQRAVPTAGMEQLAKRHPESDHESERGQRRSAG